MKPFAVLITALALSATLAVSDAEAARRLGGGKSVGMQRDSLSSQKSMTPPAAAPQAPAAANAARPQAPATAAPQPAPKRSWMGPLAGLAAGLGLAALASHFGFGEQLATMLMIGLAVMAVLALVGFILRRRAQTLAPAGAQGMRLDPSWQDSTPETSPTRSALAEAPQGSSTTVTGGHIPADFDVEGFVRQAKVSFLRLQAANDIKNLDDIREFTTPEMYGEIKMAFMDSGNATQETDIVELTAEIVDVTQDAARHVVTVRFRGQARIDRGAEIEVIDELWHIAKPASGGQGWLLAGIQQIQ